MHENLIASVFRLAQPVNDVANWSVGKPRRRLSG